jgi:hypothetical protein
MHVVRKNLKSSSPTKAQVQFGINYEEKIRSRRRLFDQHHSRSRRSSAMPESFSIPYRLKSLSTWCQNLRTGHHKASRGQESECFNIKEFSELGSINEKKISSRSSTKVRLHTHKRMVCRRHCKASLTCPVESSSSGRWCSMQFMLYNTFVISLCSCVRRFLHATYITVRVAFPVNQSTSGCKTRRA